MFIRFGLALTMRSRSDSKNNDLCFFHRAQTVNHCKNCCERRCRTVPAFFSGLSKTVIELSMCKPMLKLPIYYLQNFSILFAVIRQWNFIIILVFNTDDCVKYAAGRIRIKVVTQCLSGV